MTVQNYTWYSNHQSKNVVINACEIPDARKSEVLEGSIWYEAKTEIIPTTVPNNPSKGATEAYNT